MTRRFVSLGVFLVSLSLLLGLACGRIQGGENELNPRVRATLRAAGWAGYTFAESASFAQAVATSDLAAARTVDDTVSLAGCPVLTASPAGSAGEVNVSVDFLQGCPLPGQESVVCLGSASGQVEPDAQHVNLTLVGVSCTEAPILDGNVDLAYSQEAGAFNLNGNWDLTLTTDVDQSQNTGTGNVTFDPSTQTVTINQFQGQLTFGSEVWSITMTGLQIPLVDNPSHLPSAGTVQLNGTLARQFTIQFNQDSPGTGKVEVTVPGGTFYVLNF